MAKKVRYKDRDLGWAALQRQLALARRKPHTVVGIWGDAATALSGKEDSADSETSGRGAAPPTNIQVATWNEFGLGVPERSFIRATVDLNAKKISNLARTMAGAVLDGRPPKSKSEKDVGGAPTEKQRGRPNNFTVNQGLDILGQFVKGRIQQRIAKGIPPSNAPSTIRAKKSSKPLIDTGQLRGSIATEVRRSK